MSRSAHAVRNLFCIFSLLHIQFAPQQRTMHFNLCSICNVCATDTNKCSAVLCNSLGNCALDTDKGSVRFIKVRSKKQQSRNGERRRQKKLHIITAMDGYFWVRGRVFYRTWIKQLFLLATLLFRCCVCLKSCFSFVLFSKILFLKMPMHERRKKK